MLVAKFELSMKTKFYTLPYLPLHLIEEIFLRLPVKSLIQFQLLSKSWASVFSSIQFQTMYHDLRVCEGPTSLVIEPQYVGGGDNPFLSYVFTDLDDREPENDPMDVMAFCSFPGTHPKCVSPNPRLLGSWNGLVALFDGVDQFMLWNPCTDECKVVTVPVKLHEDICSSLFLLGLCYDITNDEYIAVLVNHYVDPPRVPREYRTYNEVENDCAIGYLISFKRGKGEELVTTFPINTMSFNSQVGTIVKGTPHWLETGNPTRIFYFDITNKDFKEMSYPRIVDNKKKVICGLGSLQGHLTIALQTPNTAEFEIWTMKNYAVEESWSRWTVIHEASLSPYDSLSLLGFTSDGEIVVDVNGDIIVESIGDKFTNNNSVTYNPSTKSFRENVYASYYGRGASKATYIPTLISPY